LAVPINADASAFEHDLALKLRHSREHGQHCPAGCCARIDRVVAASISSNGRFCLSFDPRAA
jgi:hypothetical protein